MKTVKSRKVIVACIFVLTGLSLTTAQVKLTFNPSKDTQYEYIMQTAQTIEQTVGGQKIPMETKINMGYLMDVKAKSPQETQLQFTFRDIAYVISSQMMNMGYDSKNPVENPSEMDKMLGKMFGALIDKPFDVNVAPDGSVTSVTGMADITDQMLQAVAADGAMAAQVSAAMKQQFNDEAMKSSFEASLKIYPATAVKAGDSWNIETAQNISGMNIITKTKYTLKEVKKNEAVIAVESTLDMQPGAGMEGKLAGTQTGTMLLDIKTGMMLSGEVSQTIKGALKAQGFDILMEMTTKTKTSTKEIK